MSGGYCKLFEDIVTSTIWQTPNNCRVLWVTMLALKDEMNICRATVPALAKICDISLEECQKYLDDFQSPDKFSRSQEYDGRRIAPIDGGWLILNGQKYRDMLRGQERRDYIRKKVAEHRERVNKSKHRKQSKPIAEAEAEADSNKKSGKPSIEEVKLHAIQIGMPELEAEKFFNHYESNGWRVGKNPMKSWRNAIAGWNLRSKEYNHPSTNGILAPIDKTILFDDRRKHEARLATIRNQYDGHQTWSADDRAEAKELKSKIAAINDRLGCLL